MFRDDEVQAAADSFRRPITKEFGRGAVPDLITPSRSAKMIPSGACSTASWNKSGLFALGHIVLPSKEKDEG
jgi:hypothetical protein